MADDPEEMHAIFYGRVQGVFFRASARDIAKRMNLVGSVRNLPDGSVEIFAQGSREQLEAFVIKLSQIFDLDPNKPHRKEHYELLNEFDDFVILY